VIVQTENRAQWGSLLAPGTYSSLRIDTEFDVCLYEPTDGHLLLSTLTGGSYHFNAVSVPTASGGTGTPGAKMTLVSIT
jgi:hypothetical protein